MQICEDHWLKKRVYSKQTLYIILPKSPLARMALDEFVRRCMFSRGVVEIGQINSKCSLGSGDLQRLVLASYIEDDIFFGREGIPCGNRNRLDAYRLTFCRIKCVFLLI